MKRKSLLIILILFLISISSNQLFAKEVSANNLQNYSLPYPGILPDNPFYKLKVIRDKISLLLINDPNKKIDFYILLTGKGLTATKALIDQNKITLAKETALKGENNFTLLTWVVKANKWNLSENQYRNIETANLKHQEILKEIIKKAPKEDKKAFETVLYFSQKNLEVVKAAQKSKTQ